jgi:inorganic pyrophosphatase
MKNLISTTHPWHGIDPGKEVPACVRCFIEIPKWSKGKYELSELPPHTLVELKKFFEDYKKLEHKNVTVEEFVNREKAYEIITDSLKLYRNTFKKRNNSQ